MTGFKQHQLPGLIVGQELYTKNCVRCHGRDGTKGAFGAKNLKISILTDHSIIQKIRDGRGFMPSFKPKLTSREINEIVLFVKSLRENP